jgi:hypothetical protein
MAKYFQHLLWVAGTILGLVAVIRLQFSWDLGEEIYSADFFQAFAGILLIRGGMVVRTYREKGREAAFYDAIGFLLVGVVAFYLCRSSLQ